MRRYTTLSHLLKYTALAAFGAAVSLPLLAQYRAAGAVIWEDGVGDVASSSKFELPDVSSVMVRSAGDHLEIHVTLAGDVERAMRQKNPRGRYVGFEFIHLYIDRDNDTATGERIRAPDGRAGYDVEVAVVTGMSTKFGKHVSWHWGLSASADPEHVDGFAANYFIRNGNFKLATVSRGRSKPKEGASIEEDAVRVLVPFDVLGIKKGDTLKLCYKDVYGKMMDTDSGPILETSSEKLLEVR